MRRVTPLWLLLFLCLWQAASLGAQELLSNPGLEEGGFGAYRTVRSGEKPFYLASGWDIWLGPSKGGRYNNSSKTSVWPHPGPGPAPQEGSRALNIDCGYVTCEVAIYQQVTVVEGSNLTASAWAQVKACNLPEDEPTCGSAVESGAQTRIGIDPNGGEDPRDGDVVWSNWAQPHDRWLEMRVNATTTGGSATLFLYSSQEEVAHLNKTYWDNVSLTGAVDTGSEAAVARPAPPAEVPFVAAQRGEDDGSLVHIVRTGHTIDSIAVAYDTTRAEILALNPAITNPSIISIGQRIIVRRAQDNAAREAPPPEEARPVEERAAAAEPAPAADTAAETSRRAVTSRVGASHAPAPVSSAALPAADPLPAGASVCVTLFDDANRNRLREPGETPLANGMLTLTGGGSETRMATGAEARCFEELAGGAWLLEVDAPAGYGLTAPRELQLRAAAGTRLDIDVGAAAGLMPVEAPPPDEAPVFSADITQDTAASLLENLSANSGYVAFALAGLVLVAGGAVTLTLWRR